MKFFNIFQKDFLIKNIRSVSKVVEIRMKKRGYEQTETIDTVEIGNAFVQSSRRRKNKSNGH